MASLGARAVVFCFPIVLGWLPLAAQSSSYHLEFDDPKSGPQEVVLVNDSEKPIEAFVASQRCQRAHGGSRAEGSEDTLFFSGLRDDIRAADRSGPPPSGLLDPGARWRTFLVMMPERGDCQNQITAVLFSDGSFEGDDAAIRSLKAGRDGLAAAVHYWVDRISQEKPDGSTLYAMLAEVKDRLAADEAKRKKYPTTTQRDPSAQPLWEYWSSQATVEGDIELLFPKDLSLEKPSETLRKIANMMTSWKIKIDSNLALQKLNAVFPPITESSESSR